MLCRDVDWHVLVHTSVFVAGEYWISTKGSGTDSEHDSPKPDWGRYQVSGGFQWMHVSEPLLLSVYPIYSYVCEMIVFCFHIQHWCGGSWYFSDCGWLTSSETIWTGGSTELFLMYIIVIICGCVVGLHGAIIFSQELLASVGVRQGILIFL